MTAEFYGQDVPEANLYLLKRFFEKYPNYRERALISVKVSVFQLSVLY